ncbi:MAG TPA: hypothetical protein VN805_09260, partial [Caulobacteraceae bacterium]|nr:hypothetical protein [Caulobacteraceae bacterium]
MSKNLRAVLECVWTGLFAVVFTGLISGIWAGLLITNLKLTPALHWAVVPMGLVLWAAWSFLGGQWGFSRSKAARAAYLRAGPLPTPAMLWAITAGLLGIVALA